MNELADRAATLLSSQELGAETKFTIRWHEIDHQLLKKKAITISHPEEERSFHGAFFQV